MKGDPRVNAKSMTFRNYVLIFISMLLFCGAYAGLYFLQIQESGAIITVLSMFTYIVVTSLVTCVFFSLFRGYFLRPIRRVCEAAQKVAAGDFSVRLAPMRRDGKKDEFEVLFEDFNTMAGELASTEMLKDDFVSNVSHELKTPLAVIQNYANLLQNDSLSDEERREYTQRIGDAAERMTVLATNILQLSRLENQKILPKLEPFNLSEALSESIIAFDSVLENSHIQLDTDMDCNVIVTSDRRLLEIVWNNLLSNAVKFTPEFGRIRVEVRREGGSALVSVSDTGCGMDSETAKHVFDKFYQGDTSHATAGNGLGLALAKRIVELLGGEIGVVSSPGEGSEFTVKLTI